MKICRPTQGKGYREQMLLNEPNTCSTKVSEILSKVTKD